MTEVSARRALTRERICDAAVTVFAERGVLGSSVEEICDTAGFTRGAFYSNFESKDDLCEAVLEHYVSGVLSAVDGVVASLTPSGDRCLDEVIALGISMFMAAQPTDRAHLLAHEELRLHAAREPAFRPVYRALEQRAADTVSTSIEHVLNAHACELTTSGSEAMGLLHAVYDHGAIRSVIDDQHSSLESRIAVLHQVLRALIRPKDETRR